MSCTTKSLVDVYLKTADLQPWQKASSWHPPANDSRVRPMLSFDPMSKEKITKIHEVHPGAWLNNSIIQNHGLPMVFVDDLKTKLSSQKPKRCRKHPKTMCLTCCAKDLALETFAPKIHRNVAQRCSERAVTGACFCFWNSPLGHSDVTRCVLSCLVVCVCVFVVV